MFRNLTCLIVDDDPMYNIVAESILASLEAGKVICAGSGNGGLEKLCADPGAIDVIFLDLNMPDLDGLAFMRAASEAGFNGNIVISSGETPAVLRSAETMGKMLGISVLGALRKPLKIDEVAALLERALESGKPSARAGAAGLNGDEFELTPYYQPQYDLNSLKILGVEALIRLTARDGRVHGPAQLFGSITGPAELTDVSLRIALKVLSDVSIWGHCPPLPTISINFDASVLEQPEVVRALQKGVVDFSINPQRLCLEVTEKTLPKEPARLVEALTRLRMTGFKLSLDDYGMGASSFELLRLCPFSEIKVDRSIIEACTTDQVTRKFLHAVAGLARDLELVSVAEGVETEAELEEVRLAGMDRVQGFLFSRPLPASAILSLAGQFGMEHER
jgi:EAL domain-containing protein (putative c-di-GMP-specific phosphodiesterase class I)